MAAKKKTTAKTSATKASATKTATTAKETVVKAADTAKDTKSAAADTKAADTVKDTKTAAEKPVAKKETKAPAKKTAKKAELVQEVYVEYGDQQIFTDEIVNRIKEKYVSEGHYLASIKSLKVYLNLEERKAYYVINDKAEDQSVEF